MPRMVLPSLRSPLSAKVTAGFRSILSWRIHGYAPELGRCTATAGTVEFLRDPPLTAAPARADPGQRLARQVAAGVLGALRSVLTSGPPAGECGAASAATSRRGGMTRAGARC